MEKNGTHLNGAKPVPQASTGEVVKELAELRARLAEIAAPMRGSYGRESVEARLTEDVSVAVQRLEARLHNCPTPEIE